MPCAGPAASTSRAAFWSCTPGLTIKDRLRVLQPNDPDSYYASRELVPGDMLDDVNRAKIVITNYHAFKLRERIELSKGGRALLQGRTGDELNTLETEGQMLQRVMPDLMGMKNILVINDEAHHCYREKPEDADDEDLKGDERKEAEKNNEAARLWISGLEAVNRKLGVSRVIDLSATPFFLRGSGYAEGTLFPWTMSDFSLMDAIECGIVKLPRVPGGREHPRRRDADVPQPLGEHPQGHAQEGARQGRRTRPAQAADPAADGAGGALRPLREDLRALGGGGHQGAALLHHRLPEHRHLQAGLRLHLRLPAEERRRHDDAGERAPGAVPQLRRDHRQPAARARTRCSSTASSSKPAMRSTTTSAAWPPTRSSGSAARSSSAPATPAPARTSPTRNCCARS